MHRRLLVTGLFIFGWGCVGPLSEDSETHYAGVAAARADGAFARGWLPEILPDDATDIWEFHNIDTNLTWACFNTPHGPGVVRTLLAQRGAARTSGPIHTGPTRFLRVRPWWPSSMGTEQIEAYSFSENTPFTIVAGIDIHAGKVCFHRR